MFVTASHVCAVFVYPLTPGLSCLTLLLPLFTTAAVAVTTTNTTTTTTTTTTTITAADSTITLRIGLRCLHCRLYRAGTVIGLSLSRSRKHINSWIIIIIISIVVTVIISLLLLRGGYEILKLCEVTNIKMYLKRDRMGCYGVDRSGSG
jgi:hypothetical protein